MFLVLLQNECFVNKKNERNKRIDLRIYERVFIASFFFQIKRALDKYNIISQLFPKEFGMDNDCILSFTYILD